MIKLRRVLLLCALLITAGCWVASTQESKPLVINVLDSALFADCHIPGSVQVDFDKVEKYLSASPKDRIIIIYCSNQACMTSHFVVKRLREKGYQNARVYADGMAGWFLAGHPVEGPAQSAYLQKKVVLGEEEADALPKISTQELAELLEIVYNRSDLKRAAA